MSLKIKGQLPWISNNTYQLDWQAQFVIEPDVTSLASVPPFKSCGGHVHGLVLATEERAVMLNFSSEFLFEMMHNDGGCLFVVTTQLCQCCSSTLWPHASEHPKFPTPMQVQILLQKWKVHLPV